MSGGKKMMDQKSVDTSITIFEGVEIDETPSHKSSGSYGGHVFRGRQKTRHFQPGLHELR
jgi:hypothetical protein